MYVHQLSIFSISSFQVDSKKKLFKKTLGCLLSNLNKVDRPLQQMQTVRIKMKGTLTIT